MKLKSLTIHGFKSFGKKSQFICKQNITAIVGPNGSGKSNVVEAIRFVLGEQSMKSLRMANSADILFRGMQEKAETAMVEMIFDNTAGVFSLPSALSSSKSEIIAFDEVRIKRILTSEGTSYLLNDQEVRLKDIQELLMSVHIGASGYHIISQGEADRLLIATPRERKAMLEEALGLRTISGKINTCMSTQCL